MSLVSGLEDQLDRAVHERVLGPFLLAAALALCALSPSPSCGGAST
jgi:hypothetical protein